jgi:hypothetical protein
LVRGTAWWSGAELAGLVRAAASHAVARHLEAGDVGAGSPGSTAQVAAAVEVIPADFDLGLLELAQQLAPALQRRKQQARAAQAEVDAKAARRLRRDAVFASDSSSSSSSSSSSNSSSSSSSSGGGGSGSWTVARLLQSVELDALYADALVGGHDVAWAELVRMSDAQLKECGVAKVGHRLRILAAAAAAQAEQQQHWDDDGNL